MLRWSLAAKRLQDLHTRYGAGNSGQHGPIRYVIIPPCHGCGSSVSTGVPVRVRVASWATFVVRVAAPAPSAWLSRCALSQAAARRPHSTHDGWAELVTAHLRQMCVGAVALAASIAAVTAATPAAPAASAAAAAAVAASVPDQSGGGGPPHSGVRHGSRLRFKSGAATVGGFSSRSVLAS